jgi:hypothetical protein
LPAESVISEASEIVVVSDGEKKKKKKSFSGKEVPDEVSKGVEICKSSWAKESKTAPINNVS